MTNNQRKFADEYLIDCNATRAYKAAYPKVKSDDVAAVNANRLLRNAKIKSYIEEHLKQISSEKTADAQEVMEYLTSVLRGKSRSTICAIVGTGDGYSEAQLIGKPPDEKERLKAAELLGKRYGIFKESLNIDLEPVVIMNDLEE